MVTEGYPPATLRHAYQLLGRIFSDAIAAGFIARTACRGINLPKIRDTEKRFLSPTEITQLADTIHPRYRVLVIASRFGHTSVKTVLDVYGHLYEGLDRNAAETLNPPWNPSDVDARWTRRTRDRNQGRGLN